MEKWEYQTVELEFKTEGGGFFKAGSLSSQHLASQLNTYGKQGWELVGFFGIEGQIGGTDIMIIATGGTQNVFATFKRKIQG